MSPHPLENGNNPPETHDALATHLLNLEERLLASETRANPDAVSALLTEDFREFGCSGRTFTRDEIVHALLTEKSTNSASPTSAVTASRPTLRL